MNDLKDEYYRFLFENTLDAIMLTQPDGRIFRANPAACKLFNRTEEEILSLGRKGLVHIEDPNLPILLEERQLRGKASGHLTFLRKDGSSFVGHITSALFKDSDGQVWSAMIVRDISPFLTSEKNLIAARDRAEIMASCDGLTGLLNRRTFDQKAKTLLALACKQGQPFSLALIDMDHFKEINDQWGHMVGDQVLLEVANLMAKSLRPQDLLGRFGGDEFIVALPDTTLETAKMVCERLRQLLTQLHESASNIPFPLSASFGVATLLDFDTCLLEDLLQQADSAMYRAKIHRNRIEG